MYSLILKEWASYGYLILAINHHDGTCAHYTDRNGYNHYATGEDLEIKELRLKQLETRQAEVKSFIDEIFGKQKDGSVFMRQKLNFPSYSKIKLENLVMSGHSFGGMTSLLCGSQDERIKCIITLDPWLYPYATDINSNDSKMFKIKQPTFTCTT